jgi:tetratricopeptide (TPR) repeat protein
MSLLAFMKVVSFPRRLLYVAGRSGFLHEPFNLLDRPPEFHQTILLLHNTFNSMARWSNQHVDDILKELERYSLITLAVDFSEITIRFHPLVKAFAHDRLEPHERASYQAAALRLLICGSGEENQDLYELISPHMPPLHPPPVTIHVNDLAGIAMIFYYEGRISEATQIWENIRDRVLLEYEEDQLQTSEVRLQLAKMYWESNDSMKRIEARIWEDRVVDFRLNSLSTDHPATARAMSQRARGLEYRNHLVEAESVRLEILRIWEKQFEPNSEEILREKENLAQTYRLGKKWIDAQNLLIGIWEVRKATKGNEHWRTLRVMESLANLYAIATSAGAAEHLTDTNTQQARAAEQLWQEVIEIRTKTRGPEHPDTLHALQSLAWCFELHGRDDKAEELWERIFACRESIQGAEHEATCQARNALAFFDYKRRRYEDAEAKWKTTMEVIERAERTKSRQLAKAMKSLARLYEKTGRKGARDLLVFWTISELALPRHNARRRAVRAAVAPIATLFSD